MLPSGGQGFNLLKINYKKYLFKQLFLFVQLYNKMLHSILYLIVLEANF